MARKNAELAAGCVWYTLDILEKPVADASWLNSTFGLNRSLEEYLKR